MSFATSRNRLAGAALIAVMALPLGAFAQTTTPSNTAATPPAAPSAGTEALPAQLAGLGLTDVQINDTRRGKRIEARLGDVPVQAALDQDGALRMVMVRDGALPPEVIEALLPQAVRNSDMMSQFATISGVHLAPEGFGVQGQDTASEPLRAMFTQDGTLTRFGRGEAMGRDGKGGPDGKRGRDGAGRHDKRAPGDHRGMMQGQGGKGEKGRQGMMQGQGGPQGAAVDDGAARQAAEAAGYTELGDSFRAGPRLLIEAKNPQGEPVVVEINPRGEVIRETAR